MKGIEGPTLKEYVMKTKMMIGIAAMLMVASQLPAQSCSNGPLVPTVQLGVHFPIKFGHDRSIRRGERHVHTAACQVVHEKGYWTYVTRKVWVPETWRTVHIPAVYDTRVLPCGQVVRVLIAPERYKKEFVPGYWTTVQDKVWVESKSHYACGQGHGRGHRF